MQQPLCKKCADPYEKQITHFHIIVEHGRVTEIVLISGGGLWELQLESLQFAVMYQEPTHTLHIPFGKAVKSMFKGMMQQTMPTPKKLRLSMKCLHEMEHLGLTAEHLQDVFWHGGYRTSKTGTPEAVKQYRDYEIGLTYRIDRQTGDYLITWCWKNGLVPAGH
jgi:hypothetical protein